METQNPGGEGRKSERSRVVNTVSIKHSSLSSMGFFSVKGRSCTWFVACQSK